MIHKNQLRKNYSKLDVEGVKREVRVKSKESEAELVDWYYICIVRGKRLLYLF